MLSMPLRSECERLRETTSYPSGFLLITEDHTVETYKYRNGTLNLVDYSDPGDGFKSFNRP
jgi:hypothetical protein